MTPSFLTVFEEWRGGMGDGLGWFLPRFLYDSSLPLFPLSLLLG